MNAKVSDRTADMAARNLPKAHAEGAMSKPKAAVKVLYVMGRGRSGSTILGNVLGEVDGFFAAGEVRDLFDPVLRRADSTCACGEPVRSCPVWSSVLEELPDELDVAAVADWQHQVVKERQLLRLRRRGPVTTPEPNRWPELARYARVMSDVYRALAERTGARVIVDTSKRPSYGMFLQHVPGCDPYYVQVVRDPRASAYSWKNRRYASVAGGEVARRGAADATLRWDLLNLGAEATLRSVPDERGVQLRYEDFAVSPRDTVQDLVRFVDEEAPSPFRDERTVELGVNHTIAGNPARQRLGKTVIELDDEWPTRSSRLDRWLSTLVALPFLHRYGYGFRSSRPA